MKQIIRTLAFLAALLLPGLAAAQCSAPLPANTVMGRLGIGPGPCEAIPFANIPLAVGGSIIGGSVGAPLFNNGGVVGNGLIASTWSTFLQVGSGAVTRTVQSKLTDMVNARDFGVVCDGVTDDAAAIRLAYAASLNVYFPSSATKCVVKSQVIITAVNSGGGGYNLGPRLMGGGREAGGTTFDNQVANNCMFLIQSAANGQFTSGVTLENFKITSTTAPATSCGIEIYRGAYVKFSNVQFTSLTGRCIYVPATAGDPDAFIQISLDRVRTDNCATGGGFGLDFSAPTGGYSGSNLRITNSTFSGSGVDSAGSAPTSGGMVFKGLIMQMVNSGFTLSNGPDLYVQGNDTSVQITLEGNDFENNTSAHWPHIFVDAGIEGFDFRNNECLNNDSFKSQGCLWFDSTLAVQGQVSIGVGNEVRASSGNNPYVAFKLTGANTVVDTFTTEPVYWQVFDGTGQVRFSGWNFKPITGQVKFSISALDTALLSVSGYGDVIPLHLGPSTGEGEWVPYHIPASGITYSTGTLTASTGYYFYVYNSAAANLPFVGTLTAATTGPVASSPGGYYVETGDTRKTYIGFAQTDSGGHFQITGVQTSQYPAGLGAISQIIPISMGTIALPQNSTIYTLMTANGAPASIQALCPKGGWFSGLSVLSTAPAAGQTLTATWQVSNIDTPLTCTITGTATTCKDSTHFAICPADSPYHLKLVTSATTGTLANIGGGVLFQHN